MNFPEIGHLFESLQKLPMSTLMTAGAAGFIAFAAGLAFSRGVVKQLLNMVALGLAATAGWYVFTHRDWAMTGGGSVTDMPTNRLLLISGGAAVIAFFIAKAGIHILAAIGIFKILGSLNGWKGVIISAIPSSFFLWLGSAGVRLIGNIQGLESTASMADTKKLKSEAESFWLKLSQHIDNSSLGSLAAKVDPFDMRAIANLARLLILWPEGSVWHTLAAQSPRNNEMLHHPRLQALGRDPDVRRAIENQDFAGLIQLKQVVAAASHPDLEPVLSGLELEQAMDAIVYKRPQPVRLR